MVSSLRPWGHTIFPEIGDGIRNVGNRIQKGCDKVYTYFDRKVVHYTGRLPEPIASVARIFVRLAPYIVLALALPTPTYVGSALGILAFKAVATKGKSLDLSGQVVGIGVALMSLGIPMIARDSALVESTSLPGGPIVPLPIDSPGALFLFIGLTSVLAVLTCKAAESLLKEPEKI